jgi:Ligase-CoA domain
MTNPKAGLTALRQNGIPAYAYSTELPVEVLAAKYKWARGARSLG